MTALQAFAYECQSRNLAEATLQCYAERLEYLIRYSKELDVPVRNFTKRNIQDYLLRCLTTASGETVNGRIRVFRVFFNFLEKEGEVPSNPMKDIRCVRADHKVVIPVKPGFVESLLEMFPKGTFHGRRNRIMILLAWDSMMRMKEIRNLKLEDIDYVSHWAVIRRGKNRSGRVQPLSPKTLKELLFYKEYWDDIPGDWLVCTEEGGQLSKAAMQHVLWRKKKVLERQPGAPKIVLSTHLLRHSGGTEIMKKTKSDMITQMILGHTLRSVTGGYVHMSPEELVEIHRLYGPAAK